MAFCRLPAVLAFSVLPVLSPALVQMGGLPEHSKDASFLGSGAHAVSVVDEADRSAEAKAEDDGPLPPDFYNAFSEGESTFEAGVEAGRPDEYQSGWEPTVKTLDGEAERTAVRPEFFHESGSPGASQAWQSHYPQVGNGPGTRNGDGNGAPWLQDLAGHWYQPYGFGVEVDGVRSSDVQKLPPGWFDSAAYSRDGYGRLQVPLEGSPKRYANWKEQSVNTTITCAERGCIANATLQAPFNWREEQAVNCKMSFSVHATDYDEDYSNEKVEWIQVNEVTVKSDCKPMASGCDEDAAKMLYPCMSEYDIVGETLLPYDGLLRIAAKNTDEVDECPYDGNLFSGVVWVTCLVGPQDPSPLFGGATNVPNNVVTAEDPEGGEQPETESVFSYYMRCKEPGCGAVTPLEFALGSEFKECFLDVSVTQTDFDNDESYEVIEYFSIEGKNVSEMIIPGLNPCKEELAGTPLTEEEKQYFLVSAWNVTTEVLQNGRLTVEAKISDLVDECAADGYLLAGVVEVTCYTYYSSASLLQERSRQHLRAEQRS